MTRRLTTQSGFTLIEVLMVLAILSILATIGMMSHRYFVEKARSVEAEVALAEIDRLESLYYANHGTYTADFGAIGFALNSSLRYYTVTVQLQKEGTAFQAIAIPFSLSKTQSALVLRHDKNEMVIQKADLSTLVGLEHSSAGSSRSLSMEQGTGTGNVESGGSSPKANCRQGGEATVAQDGLLDMNFCLK